MNTTPNTARARWAAWRASIQAALFILCALAGTVRLGTAQDLDEAATGETRPRGSALDIAAAPIEGRIDPDTYRVGPGDEFAFRHSDLLDAQILRVDPSGDLLLPDAGAIPIAGLTLRQAEAKIRASLKAYVRGKGLVFTLHRPRRFRIPVLGEVARPGVVTLQAPARAADAIDAAGGTSALAALRGIEVRRGADTLHVDLIRYVREGAIDANPLVFETDILYVPPAGRRIEIRGAVPHGGRYDFAPGDRLSRLVALAGGVLPQAALEDATLSRFEAGGGEATVSIRLAEAIGSAGGESDIPLEDGDRLFIPARAHWKEGAAVEVNGEVVRAGSYPIRDGVDRIRSVIDRAGGLTEFADPARARIERVIEPDAPDTAFLNLARIRDDLLSRDDREYVKLKTRERQAVSVDLGALLTGGGAGADIPLRDGDRVFVPRRVLTVSVQGEVRAPGHVPYEPGRRASEYIGRAGGFSERADRGRVRVTLSATNHQVGANDAGPLHAGDTVWVPSKQDRSAWGAFKDVLGTAAQLATIYLVIQQATK